MLSGQKLRVTPGLRGAPGPRGAPGLRVTPGLRGTPGPCGTPEFHGTPACPLPLLHAGESAFLGTHLHNEVTVPREVLSVQESDGRGKDLRLPVHLLTAPASHARGKRGGLEHPNSVPAAPLSKGASRGG